MTKILAVFFLSALLTTALAEDMYKVELIVFENLDPAAALSEHWPAQPGEVSLENSLDLAHPGTPGNNAWRMMSAAELGLGGVIQRLKSSSRYRPLLHVGWVQALDNSDRGIGVQVRGGGVEGVVALRRGRFLHTDIDLLYNKTLPPASMVMPNAGQALRVRLNNSRRLRNGELHYVDHPLFGVIITVSPVN